MVTITLLDGKSFSFSGPITGMDVAEKIGPGLAKAAIAIEVSGELRDLSREIDIDSEIRIITAKDPEGLEIIRHDAAHVLAEAVKELYPEVQITIGPVIDHGFYYDIARDEPFSSDDLEEIEKRMHEIIDRDEKVERELWDRDEAVAFFKKQGELYKAEIIASIPSNEPITLYRQGDFIDLCRGPHAPSTGKVGKAFKLMKLAGAYWRGDSRNPMLQRIYGTAWADKKELKQYLHQLEEAEKRDHRKLGAAMDLFHLQEEARGMAFWHDKGWTLFRTMEEYIRRKIRADGYIEVKTPMLVDRTLWEKSGHWEKFRENMFTAEVDDDVLALKPMNCPCHVQIYNLGITSYRDLPIRMAEFGVCHRNESSGSLHGLMRVRNFTQDDAHIFCTEEQITSETIRFCKLLREVYRDFGYEEVNIKFADRPEVRAGDDTIWDQAESSLREAVEATGLPYAMNPGEGAFYGPKLEFYLRDAIGRDWQCGTLQLDFVLPDRLGASYIGADGQKHRPVMVHRAILGTIERFMGILIEEYAGNLPLWLAPVQVAVLTITNDLDDYAKQVKARLEASSIRVEIDITPDKINYKIRQHSLKKVPIILVVGHKEKENGQVSVRRLGSEKQEVISLEDFLTLIEDEKHAPSERSQPVSRQESVTTLS